MFFTQDLTTYLTNIKHNITLKIIIAICFAFQIWGAEVFAQSDDVFTIYLVRHSEKDHFSNNVSDLPLSNCGEQRAIALSNFLNDINLDVIYSTDYTRTKNTAMPTADKKGIEITLYNEQDIESFSNLLLENKQNALVVGHSNTTGVLTGLLVNQEIGDIDLDVYDHIYQVLIVGKSHRHNLFKSSFECLE